MRLINFIFLYLFYTINFFSELSFSQVYKKLEIKSQEVIHSVERSANGSLHTEFCTLGYVLETDKQNENKFILKSILNDNTIYSHELNQGNGSFLLDDNSNTIRCFYPENGNSNRNWLLKIFFIKDKREIILRDDEKQIGGTVVSLNANKILYQKRKSLSEPIEIFQCDLEGKNHEFITYGIPLAWSPDGKWFIIKTSDIGFCHLKALRKENKISEKEYQEIISGKNDDKIQPKYYIYNSYNKKPSYFFKDITDFNANFIFSPNNKFVAVLNNGKIDIYKLKIESETIKPHYIATIKSGKSEWPRIETIGTFISWSPSSNKVAYTLTSLNDDSMENSDIWIYDYNAKLNYSLTNTSDVFEDRAKWLNDTTIVIEEINKEFKSMKLVQLNLN